MVKKMLCKDAPAKEHYKQPPSSGNRFPKLALLPRALKYCELDRNLGYKQHSAQQHQPSKTAETPALLKYYTSRIV